MQSFNNFLDSYVSNHLKEKLDNLNQEAIALYAKMQNDLLSGKPKDEIFVAFSNELSKINYQHGLAFTTDLLRAYHTWLTGCFELKQKEC